MKAAEYLGKYNLTVKQAYDFIVTNLNKLDLVVYVAKQYGVTNDMLAEIVNTDVSTVKSYLTQHGFKSTDLDTSSPTIFPPSTTVQVAVSADGSSNASTANNVYSIAPGTYTYHITGFGAGDVLSFPATNAASVNNSSFTDGEVELTWAYHGTVATIHLMGIPTATDSMLNSVANFNSVFGAGTVI